MPNEVKVDEPIAKIRENGWQMAFGDEMGDAEIGMGMGMWCGS